MKQTKDFSFDESSSSCTKQFDEQSALRNSQLIRQSQIILFDKIESNVGNSFNTTTGQFKVPKSGLYFFTFWGYRSHLIDSSLDIRLYHENRLMSSWEMYEAKPSPTSSGGDKMVNLQKMLWCEKNDLVYLRLHNNSNVLKGGLNRFTGTLITPAPLSVSADKNSLANEYREVKTSFKSLVNAREFLTKLLNSKNISKFDG